MATPNRQSDLGAIQWKQIVYNLNGIHFPFISNNDKAMIWPSSEYAAHERAVRKMQLARHKVLRKYTAHTTI